MGPAASADGTGGGGAGLPEGLLNEQMVPPHLARPGFRTLNTHVQSNQGPIPRLVTDGRGSQHIGTGFRPQTGISW